VAHLNPARAWLISSRDARVWW